MHSKHSLWAGNRVKVIEIQNEVRPIPQYWEGLKQGRMSLYRLCNSLLSYRFDAAISWYNFMDCNAQSLLAFKILGGPKLATKCGSCCCIGVSPALRWVPTRQPHLCLCTHLLQQGEGIKCSLSC